MQSKNIASDAATMPALDFTNRHTLYIGSEVGNLTRADFKRLDKVLKDLPAEQRAAILIVVADCIAHANGDGYIEHQNRVIPIIHDLRQQVAELTQPQMLAA